MHNHTFRLIDVATIVEAKTGKTIADGDADGRYDAEVVILHDSDLADLETNGVAANTVYFGDMVINGYDASAVRAEFSVNGVTSLIVRFTDSMLPIGNIQPCLMFDTVENLEAIFVTFYGWKITLNP
jgi:hypothetical protein